jgi:hypothetical protein
MEENLVPARPNLLLAVIYIDGQGPNHRGKIGSDFHSIEVEV